MVTQSEIQEREIRSLSIKQPFASLMFVGKVETRSFSTNYRGLVMIAASQQSFKHDHLCGMMGADAVRNLRGLPMPNGLAIGIGRLVDCRPLQEGDPHFIQWHRVWASHYAWIFDDVTPIVQFGFKGQLGMPRITRATRDMIRVLDHPFVEQSVATRLLNFDNPL